MSETTGIEWADSTFNPWIGCTKVSPACDNCYAEVSTPSRTQGIEWGKGKARKRTSAANWAQPLRWERNHEVFFAKHGRRQRVFCASLADVFDNEVNPQWRVDLFDLIRQTPNLDWLLLTKRVGNVTKLLCESLSIERSRNKSKTQNERLLENWLSDWIDGNPPSNVWLGATICNQVEADRDVSKLLATPAAKRFLSIEPMLGPIDLTKIDDKLFDGKLNALAGFFKWNTGQRTKEKARLDQIICGGESGPNARPTHPDWVRSLRDQCSSASVAFYFKQWGEWARTLEPTHWVSSRGIVRSVGSGAWSSDAGIRRVGKKAAGRLLDGRTWDQFPEVR